MPNFHNALTNMALFRTEDLNPPLAGLDRALSYAKNVIVTTDGEITYDSATGILTWAAAIRIIFTAADGTLILNTIAAGNITIADGQMVYVDLIATTGTALTAAVATVTTGGASSTVVYNRLVLGARNATNDKFYPVALKFPYVAVVDASDTMKKSVYDTTGDGKADAANTADEVPFAGITDFPENLTDLQNLVVNLANAGKVIVVSADGTALALADVSSGAGAFVELSDAPANYTDAGGKIVAVKADGTGLEFISLSSSSTLATLGDVVIASISDGQSIKWDAASGKFVNYTPSSGGGGTASFASVATISGFING